MHCYPMRTLIQFLRKVKVKQISTVSDNRQRVIENGTAYGGGGVRNFTNPSVTLIIVDTSIIDGRSGLDSLVRSNLIWMQRSLCTYVSIIY